MYTNSFSSPLTNDFLTHVVINESTVEVYLKGSKLLTLSATSFDGSTIYKSEGFYSKTVLLRYDNLSEFILLEAICHTVKNRLVVTVGEVEVNHSNQLMEDLGKLIPKGELALMVNDLLYNFEVVSAGDKVDLRGQDYEISSILFRYGSIMETVDLFLYALRSTSKDVGKIVTEFTYIFEGTLGDGVVVLKDGRHIGFMDSKFKDFLYEIHKASRRN